MKHLLNKNFGILILSIFIYTCSSPMSKKFNEKTSKEDIEIISKKLDSSELGLLIGNIIRLKYQDKELEKMTYSEILRNGKKWELKQDQIEAKQKALAKKIKKEEEEKRERLSSVLIVSMYNKGFEKYSYQEYLTYSLAFENKTEKAIRAFKGSLSINDLFDVKIKSINITVDDPIAAEKTFKSTYTTDYNQFKDADVRLKSKDLNDLKIVWIPEKIIFADGSTIE